MKRILYISQKPFYPQKDGGTQAMYLFFQSLIACHDVQVTYLPICTNKHPENGLPTGLNPFNYKPLTISTRLNLSKIFMMIFTRYPLNVIRYRDRKVLNVLKETINSGGFHAIVCDGFYALSLIPFGSLTREKVIYRSHNIESNYWSYKMLYNRSFRKLIFAFIYKRMANYEPELVRMSNMVLSIAKDEVSILRHWNSNTKLCLPHINEYADKVTFKTNTPSIGFVGDMNWFPNQLALEEFISELWPSVLRQNPELCFHIAGRNSEKYTDVNQSIVGFGFLPDLTLFYQDQLFIINPVRHGTGFNMKILESLMHGKSLVTYEERLSGLAHYDCFFAVNTKDDFIAALNTLVKSPELRKAKEHAIKELIQVEFNPKDRIHQLEEIIHGA